VIILLWLLFLRISRAAWVEMRSETRKSKSEATTPAVARVNSPVVAPNVSMARETVARSAGGPQSAQGTKELFLIRLEGDVPRDRFPIGREITLGRSEGCSIKLDDSFVSGIHARVFMEGSELLIADLSSTNGTFVNSQRITKSQKLVVGDTIMVGQNQFVVGV
jgi:hypothetical protein